jgi:general secretion pathway protein G
MPQGSNISSITFSSSQRNKMLAQRRGFTLIELLIVMSVMGVLSGIAVPVYFNYIEKAKTAKAIAEIRTLEKEVLAFQISNSAGNLPVTLNQIGYGGMVDPWGKPYQYFNIATLTGNGQRREDGAGNPINKVFDLYSLGKDGLSSPSVTDMKSRDDIIYAKYGQFVGLGIGL